MGGIDSKYGTIVVKAGTSANLTFQVFDRDTGLPIRMPSVSYTFFDLDEGEYHQESEYITVGSFKSLELSKDTELKQTDNADGTTTIRASTMGTFKDNPVDPLLLTEQQKNRAVTLTFTDVEKVTVVIGATAGFSSPARAFSFVGHPVLACAKTVGKAKSSKTIGKAKTSIDSSPTFNYKGLVVPVVILFCLGVLLCALGSCCC